MSLFSNKTKRALDPADYNPLPPTVPHERVAEDTPPTFRSTATALLTIVACMAGVAALSWFFLIHQSMRLDESQSLWQASHSLAGTLHTVALDVHVPLYHLILHFWIFYFGNSIVTARLLSLIFFLATIPIVYFLARQLLSRRMGLIVVVLFSFSPFLDWYANEARMYTLLLFLTVLNQLFFMRILRTGKGWLWYGLTAVIGAYSHYFFMFNLAAQALFYLFAHRNFRKGTLKRLIAVALLVALVITPWLLYVRTLGSASGTRPMLPVPSTVDFFNVYSQFIFGFQTDFINTLILSAWPVAMLLALVAVRRSNGITPQMKFIAAMSLLPVLLAYAVSISVTPFFLSRYMVIAVAPCLLTLVYLFSRYRRKMAIISIGILFMLTAATSYLQITSPRTPVKEDYQQAALDINHTVKPQDIVVLSAPFTVYPFEYYYRGDARIATIPLWNRSEAGAIPAFNKATLGMDVTSLNKDHRYVYLLLSQDQGYEDTVHNYYLTHFKQVSKKTYSEDLTLYVYQVGYYQVPAIGGKEAASPL